MAMRRVIRRTSCNADPMRIAVLGTGVVGRTLAARLDELGHDTPLGLLLPTPS
jgi:hypothetical protein